MSEPAAWEFLADRVMDDWMMFGLCLSIIRLWHLGGITLRTRKQMQNRLILNKPKRARSDNFWWPRTPAGAKARARFARRMAEQARAEGVRC